jgi:hypothetical protein
MRRPNCPFLMLETCSVGGGLPPQALRRLWYHKSIDNPEADVYASRTSAVRVRSDFVCSERRNRAAPVCAGNPNVGPSLGSVIVTFSQRKEKVSPARSQPSQAARFTNAARQISRCCLLVVASR